MSDGGAARGGLPLRALEELLAVLEARVPAEDVRRSLIALVLRRVAAIAFDSAGLSLPAEARLVRLGDQERALDEDPAVRALGEPVASAVLAGFEGSRERIPEVLGAVFEALLALDIEGSRGGRRLGATRRRRSTGSFFTPSALTAEVVARALRALDAVGRADASEPSVCDPACGAGAFLVAVARELLKRRRGLAESSGLPFDEAAERRSIVENTLAGVDIDPLAVAVCELALWAFAAGADGRGATARLHVGDALTGRGFVDGEFDRRDPRALDWQAAFPGTRSFDLVIGNPPWIAYAGRASQPLSQERRAFFARRYAAFHGYPTLHAVFVERAAELGRAGVVALVVPSPIADLDGYRPLRRALLATHTLDEPLLEFGQDAFAEVTQPCFALIAAARREVAPVSADAGRAFRLSERARHGTAARAVEVPGALLRLLALEKLPHELFREMGFQTTRAVTESLLARADSPTEHHTYPLLEGREVTEFRVGPPRLFLRPDRDVLESSRCRLRAREEYERVRLVVRQTAKAPIAALHSGLPFRNTLLAGFETQELPAALIVGLLNSALYRAFHLSTQRDGRQAVFPQVKIGHLRALPRPPNGREPEKKHLCSVVEHATRSGITPELRRDLDALVFSLFDFDVRDRQETLAFLGERAPELAR